MSRQLGTALRQLRSPHSTVNGPKGRSPPESAERWARPNGGWGHEDQFPPARLSVSCRFCQATFAGTDGEGRDAPKANSPFDRQRRSNWLQYTWERGPGDGADCRLRVHQMQPGQLFLGKYVPCRPKQFGMIERTNMKIRQSGQADRFASQR